MIEALESRIAPATLFWRGAVSNLWSGSGNWVDVSLSPTTISPGDTLVFDDAAVSFSSTNDTNPGTPYAINIAANSAYTIGGNAISLLATGLVKTGGGTAIVANSLGGAGGVAVGGGTLSLPATNAFAGGVTVSTGTL